MIQDKRFVIRTCLVDKDENSGQLNYDFRTKTGSNWFDLVFSVWLGFFSIFFGFGSVWFFQFQAYKTKIKPVSYFKILICFFLRFGFFSYFIFIFIFLI
jgi:hypothetical protein